MRISPEARECARMAWEDHARFYISSTSAYAEIISMQGEEERSRRISDIMNAEANERFLMALEQIESEALGSLWEGQQADPPSACTS